MNNIFYRNYFSSIAANVASVSDYDLQRCSQAILKANAEGGKIIIIGNGGSSAIASHVSVDFTKAAGVRAINFNEADLITCLANDFGYEQWVSQALQFYADPGDVVILISSSGQSPNILNGAKQCQEMELKLITLSGFSKDNPLSNMGFINFWVDSTQYNVVEMVHHIWLLAVVDGLLAHSL